MTSPYDDALTGDQLERSQILTGSIQTCPDRTGTPKLFGGSACNIKALYQGFRNAYPGETGPRNYLRIPSYMNRRSWSSEGMEDALERKALTQASSWDVFNFANHQPFGAVDTSRTGLGVAPRSCTAEPEPSY